MKQKRKSLKKTLEPYCWLLPAFLLFIPFTFMPFLQTIYKSFFIVDSMGTLKRFVGFENYLYILKDETFVKAVVNTLVYVVLTVPVSKILGNRRRKTSFIYETSFALPMAMAVSVTAMIFQLLYVPSLGFINGITGLKINWLTDPKYAMIAIAVIQIWLSTGYAFIFMLAAVRSVPRDIIESASIDGAGPVRQLLQIYLPLTTPTMFYLIITDLSYSMMMMSLVSVLTDGGPKNSTITIMYYIFKQIAAAGNYTNANPAAIIAFIMTLTATLLGFLWEKKGVHYS